MPEAITNINYNGDHRSLVDALMGIEWSGIKNATFILRNGKTIKLRKTKKVVLSFDRNHGTIGLEPVDDPAKQLRKVIGASDVCAFFVKADATSDAADSSDKG